MCVSRCFTLTVRDVDGSLRVSASATADEWPALVARLTIAGAIQLSVPPHAYGTKAGTFAFLPVDGAPVVPEGYELDAFMRKLFVGFNAGAVNE